MSHPSLNFRATRPTKQLLVLCYHAISPTWSAGLSVTPEAFERQISGLVRRGWSPATFSDAVARPPVGMTLAVTFDDAFASVKRYALPVLSRLGVVATVFVPTDYVSRQVPLAWAGMDHWQRSADVHELTPMTWEDLGELAEAGWEIGSHTCSHPLLTSVSDEQLSAELSRSRAECAARIGRPVAAIAYPYGGVDDRVQERTRAAGYEVAAALEWPTARSNPHRYPRVGVYHKDSWLRFRVKIARWTRTARGPRLLAPRQ